MCLCIHTHMCKGLFESHLSSGAQFKYYFLHSLPCSSQLKINGPSSGLSESFHVFLMCPTPPCLLLHLRYTWQYPNPWTENRQMLIWAAFKNQSLVNCWCYVPMNVYLLNRNTVGFAISFAWQGQHISVQLTNIHGHMLCTSGVSGK